MAGVVEVEILQNSDSTLSKEVLVDNVKNWLSNRASLKSEVIDLGAPGIGNENLKKHVSSLSLNSYYPEETLPSEPLQIICYPYLFHSTAPEPPEVENEQQISTQWILPTADFHGLWDSLIYDSKVKEELLNYIFTALYFSEKNIDPTVISCNRIVLLHGPPGTGKTSLCKALAQKLSIRLASRFSYGHLIEVNTHSLFSKWFSESGKLVSKMFNSIISLVEDPTALVILLLDEVETIAHSRTSALVGNEPSDALRAVNSLLTHLDLIKRYPNVLILTTSNITEAIDVALIDRADIKKYIGKPSFEAIYHIYFSCIAELVKRDVIVCMGLPLLQLNQLNNKNNSLNDRLIQASRKLAQVSKDSLGLSGRTLRKLPFLACSSLRVPNVSLETFLDALSKAVNSYKEDVKSLNLKP